MLRWPWIVALNKELLALSCSLENFVELYGRDSATAVAVSKDFAEAGVPAIYPYQSRLLFDRMDDLNAYSTYA